MAANIRTLFYKRQARCLWMRMLSPGLREKEVLPPLIKTKAALANTQNASTNVSRNKNFKKGPVRCESGDSG